MTLRVGLTGGIGSGKSTVANVFHILGVPVYQADDAAKRLMNEDEDLKADLLRHFGTQTYENGRVNRSWLAAQVFNNPQKLQLLNSLVHPATIRDGEAWMQKQQTPYAIKEAAIIFESGSQRDLDYIIGVYAPPTLRLHRSMQRDNATADAVKARMLRQLDDEIKMKLCDTVITNDDIQPIIPQVMKVHEYLLSRV